MPLDAGGVVLASVVNGRTQQRGIYSLAAPLRADCKTGDPTITGIRLQEPCQGTVSDHTRKSIAESHSGLSDRPPLDVSDEPRGNV